MGILLLEQGSYSFKLFKFHDLPKFFMTIGLAATLKISLLLGHFSDLTQYNRQLWCPQKCVQFALFNHLSLSYIVLALTSAATNLTDIALIFRDN